MFDIVGVVYPLVNSISDAAAGDDQSTTGGNHPVRWRQRSFVPAGPSEGGLRHPCVVSRYGVTWLAHQPAWSRTPTHAGAGDDDKGLRLVCDISADTSRRDAWDPGDTKGNVRDDHQLRNVTAFLIDWVIAAAQTNDPSRSSHGAPGTAARSIRISRQR